MFSTCATVIHMAKMIQIRNVPDDLHRKLKARAAEKGMSLSDYLKAELQEIAELPTVEEMVARLRSRPRVDIGDEAVQIIRRTRDAG